MRSEKPRRKKDKAHEFNKERREIFKTRTEETRERKGQR